MNQFVYAFLNAPKDDNNLIYRRRVHIRNQLQTEEIKVRSLAVFFFFKGKITQLADIAESSASPKGMAGGLNGAFTKMVGSRDSHIVTAKVGHSRDPSIGSLLEERFTQSDIKSPIFFHQTSRPLLGET